MELLRDLFEGFQPGPNAILDIALTAILIYGVLSLIQGTRAVRLVVGAVVLYVIFLLAQALDLVLLTTILQTGAVVGVVALVVIFQPELRRGLDRLGRMTALPWLTASHAASHQRMATTIASAAAALSRRRVGALIVIERDTGLADMAESGIRLDAALSADLLTTIFTPGSALHDGAAIVSGDQVEAAGVMLPLATRMASGRRYGTRHRAAVGVTEQTDALAVVVSEETGAISLAEAGSISHGLAEEDLRHRLFARLDPTSIPRSTQRSRSRQAERAAPSTADAGEASSPAARPGERGRTAEDGAPSTGTVGTSK